MIRKNKVVITVVFALLLAAAVTYRQRQEKPQPTAMVKTSQSLAVVVPNSNSTQSQASAPQLERGLPEGAKREPISGHPLHAQQSSDLIVAMMQHQELNLSKNEMEKLLAGYVTVCSARTHYEATIATVEVINPNQSVVTIPMYPGEGAKLKTDLLTQFVGAVGDERGREVFNALFPTLYARNFAFGDTEQKITVTLLENEPVTYTFSHATAEMKVPYKNGFVSVQHGGLDSIHTLDNLGAYAGFENLLPKGGS